MKCSLWRLFVIIYSSLNIKNMKEIILKVPEQKVDFVLELICQLGLEVSSEQMEIPEKHKEIVRKRIQKSRANPEHLKDWEQVKDTFTLD